MQRSVRGVAALLGISFSMLGGSVAAQEKTALVTERDKVSYAIGVAHPTSISVTTFGTGRISDDDIEKLIRKHFDLRPYGILKMLDLIHPMYQATASYGHFGRTPYALKDAAGNAFTAFSWEKTDRAEALRADAKLK